MTKMTHLSLFSGIGGLDIAAEWAGFETVGQCEWADYPTKVLEKHWPDVPRWRDIHSRVAKHYIVWGCNYFDHEFASGRIVWDKCNKGSSFSDCELAATDLFSTVRLFRFMWNGMLQGKSIAEGHIMQGNKRLNEQRIHPIF